MTFPRLLSLSRYDTAVTQPRAAGLRTGCPGKGTDEIPRTKGTTMASTSTPDATTVSVKDIKTALGYSTLKEFSADWKTLTDQGKADIRGGIQNGSMTY